MQQRSSRPAALEDFALYPASGVPLAQQIRQHYSRSITKGALHAGDLLPAVRLLAQQLKVNVNTVRAAYQRLEADGLVRTSQGVGTEVLPLNPDRLMRLARAETTNTVGVILPSLGSPFYHPFLEGVEEVAHQDRTLLLICNTHDQPQEMMRCFAQLTAQHIDGILAASCNLCNLLPRQTAPGAALPVVTADWPGCTGYSVQMDLENAGYQATRHLIDHGHQRIGLITIDRESPNVQPLIEGYAKALKAAGIVRDGSLTARVPGFEMPHGEQGLQHLLALAKPPTAIFAIADPLALGALQAARHAGLGVPQDIALASFSDIAVAALVTPALTTVGAPARELGRQAMSMLSNIMAGRRPPRKTITLPTSLVIRESCGPHDPTRRR